jgi:hypothetical protein
LLLPSAGRCFGIPQLTITIWYTSNLCCRDIYVCPIRVNNEQNYTVVSQLKIPREVGASTFTCHSVFKLWMFKQITSVFSRNFVCANSAGGGSHPRCQCISFYGSDPLHVRSGVCAARSKPARQGMQSIKPLAGRQTKGTSFLPDRQSCSGTVPADRKSVIRIGLLRQTDRQTDIIPCQLGSVSTLQ